MGDVYQNAILNIAATSAANSSQGLFRVRDSRELQETTVTITEGWCGGSEHGKYTLVHSEIWTELLGKTPLLQRGWVFQERVLAKRMLHFGDKQVMWECASLQASETYPEGKSRNDPEKSAKTILNKMEKSRSSYVEIKERRSFFHKCWRDLVCQYSVYDLTKEEDKLVALSGLASKVSAYLVPDDIYVAGIWRGDLCNGLLWFILTLQEGVDGVQAVRVKHSAMPSWSWASIKGRISFHPEVYAGEDIIEIIGFDTSLVIPENRLGQVSGGRITIWAWLLSTELAAGSVTRTAHRHIIRTSGCGSSSGPLTELNTGVFYPDDDDEYAVSSGNAAICLPLKLYYLSPDKTPFLAGIVVKEDSKSHEFRRTGMFTGVYGNGVSAFYKSQKGHFITLV